MGRATDRGGRGKPRRTNPRRYFVEGVASEHEWRCGNRQIARVYWGIRPGGEPFIAKIADRLRRPAKEVNQGGHHSKFEKRSAFCRRRSGRLSKGGHRSGCGGRQWR